MLDLLISHWWPNPSGLIKLLFCYGFAQGDHVESDDNLTHKTKLYFSTAVESWDADFYLKVDDNILVNIGKLSCSVLKGLALLSHRLLDQFMQVL